MRDWTLIAFTLMLLGTASGPEQSTPNLSGDWVLVRATASSARSGGHDRPYEQTTGGARTTATTFSGAAFNCGRECTIVHKGQELTIKDARLGANKIPAPMVTLHLDGRHSPVVDSFSPTRELSVMAKWNGRKLEVLTQGVSDTVAQHITIEVDQLVVIGFYDRDPSRSVTIRYAKKAR